MIASDLTKALIGLLLTAAMPLVTKSVYGADDFSPKAQVDRPEAPSPVGRIGSRVIQASGYWTLGRTTYDLTVGDARRKTAARKKMLVDLGRIGPKSGSIAHVGWLRAICGDEDVEFIIVTNHDSLRPDQVLELFPEASILEISISGGPRKPRCDKDE